MKLFRTLLRLALLGSVLIVSNNAYSAKKHFLENLVGSWRGKGFVVTSVNAKEEAVRCRLRNKVDAKKPKLNISGNCSIGGVLVPMGGWIIRSGKSKKYSASLFKSLTFLRVDRFSGRLKGSRLYMSFKGEDKVNKVKISVSVAITAKGSKKFSIALAGTDENTRKPFKIGTIKFSRK